MQHDFTYYDDATGGLIRVMYKPSQIKLNASYTTRKAPYTICNIGNNSPVELMTFIEVIEKAVGKTSEKHYYLCSMVICHALMHM